jgi:hypothetical protein
MLKHLLKELPQNKLKIRIDGIKDKKTKEINISLRKEFEIKDFKMIDSKNDVLIQLADMVANIFYTKLKNNEIQKDLKIKKCLRYLPN